MDDKVNDKIYYAERNRLVKRQNIDFPVFKKLFLTIYKTFKRDFYFREATGYECVDTGEITGTWGDDVETFIYSKTWLLNTWPIEDNIEDFDESTLFTLIEFFYDYVSEPQYRYYHSWDNCGWHTSDYDEEKGKERYKDELNKILRDYKNGYKLSDDGDILEIAPTGLEPLFEEAVKTNDPKNIDSRIMYAKSKFSRYSSSIEDKKDAIRTLADVLEYLKDCLKEDGTYLLKDDDSALFNIINNYDIRHHKQMQKNDYDKEVWYDWMFYTFLTSIHVLLKLNNKKFGRKYSIQRRTKK